MTLIEILKELKTELLNFNIYFTHNQLSKNETESENWLLKHNSEYGLNHPYIFEKYPNSTKFRNVENAIRMHDVLMASWLKFDVPNLILEFIESHQKTTGEIFYIVGKHLMDEHDNFYSFFEQYKNQTLYKDLPINEIYTNSMEIRILVIKSFIYELTKYSTELKKEIKFTETEIIKFNDFKETLILEIPKPKLNKNEWSLFTRYELLKTKFPEIITTLDKISPVGNKNKLLSQIMGINVDTAKSLINGQYKHGKNDSELKDMNDFLKELSSNK
jgi:hypothetical protein